MKSIPWRILALGPLLVTLGCETARTDPQGIAARDSAGVRVVGSDSGAPRTAPWVLSPTPSLAVGEVEGDRDYLLSRVSGALRLSDGRLVIGELGGEIRFFSPAGRFELRRGGRGEAPGEYERLRGLARCARAGFTAFDLNWDLNHYAEDGTFLDERELFTPTGTAPYYLACDESHVATIGWGLDFEGPPPVGLFATRDRLLLSDSAGAVVADLGDWLVSERLGSPSGSGPHPFGRGTVFALHGGRLYVGTGERLEVRIFGVDGELQSVVRGPSGSLEITDSLRSAYLEVRLAATPPARQPAVRQRVAEMAWPPERPAYTALWVDPDGVAWARRFAVGPGAPERWALLDPAAGYLGDLELGAGQTLLRPERDEILVLARDSLDVERVLALPLDRSGG